MEKAARHSRPSVMSPAHGREPQLPRVAALFPEMCHVGTQSHIPPWRVPAPRTHPPLGAPIIAWDSAPRPRGNSSLLPYLRRPQLPPSQTT